MQLFHLKDDGEHHYSIKEIKPESQMPALFDKEIIITNLQFDNKFEQFDDSYKDGVVLFVGLKSRSNIIREYTVYHRGRTIDGSLQNDATTESFIYNTIKPKSEKNNRPHIHSLFENIHKFDISACRTQITMRDFEDATGTQTNVRYLMPVKFKISIPLDDLLIFSAFADYPNGMFGDLKIKFKINPNAFEFAQVSPTVSLAKYYKMNKDELLSSGQSNLDVLLIFITSIRTEQLIPSGLKNLVCNIAPVTVSIKNYVVTEITTHMAGYKATNACLAKQFFQLQLKASNLVLLFEATDEFEDELTTLRNTATIELSGAPIYHEVTDCYYYVDINGKRPPPPILCTVHVTFWLLSPNQGGSCLYNVTHSFDEVINEIGA
ncbi:MAG: hypothetical protein EZS28_014984 [Streblomastix strix]|uniref:Uncharacterized protein n=1 Tax=Streblomastix strix TaxID=222440 RepID=A0A5J4W3M8_9EUKA|nr:MAG: hypothetical protein EZS28_014984 [Streblomastix strix]